MVPSMLRHVPAIVLGAAAALIAARCTAGTSTTVATSSTPQASATPAQPSSFTPAADLHIPAAATGEVSRTTWRTSGVPAPGQTSIIGDPKAGRSYVVKGACQATASGLTEVTYRLIDARSSSAGRSLDDRTVVQSSFPCDGWEHQDGVGTLTFPVTVQYDGVLTGVTTAYTVVVPG